ncbi:MAG: DHH family phosphoesterase [Nitrososphaeria archaeon]|nr:DHH family phosphoesterase [Conexivisphaerales archaeon]
MQKNAEKIFIVHTDLDGVCSGAIAKRAFGNDIKIKFAGPRTLYDTLKRIGSCSLLGIVDVALNHSDYEKVVKEILRLKASGCELIWVDHHEWAEEDKKISQHVRLILEKSPSAASILYRTFAKDDEIAKKIAEIADDGDSNRNELELTLAYKIGTRSNRERLELINMFSRGAFYNEKIEEYKKRVEEENKLIEELAESANVFNSATGLKVAVIDLRGKKLIGSLLAKKLQQKGVDVVFIIYSDSSGVLYGDGKVNLLEIAKKYNGGGHPSACGVNFKLGFFDKLLTRISKKHVPTQAKKLLNDLKTL